MKKLFLTSCCAVVFSSPAWSGCIILKSNQSWALVEVREGKFLNSDQNPVIFGPSPVGVGVVKTGAEDTMICYRRENIPGVPGSGLMTSAMCSTRNISGCEDMYIQ